MALNFKPLQYEPGGSMYAPRIGEDVWNLYRPQIEQLYIGHGKTLDEVMAAMAHDHNFTPTESQYKIQFRRWKLRKNRVGGVPPPQRALNSAATATSEAGPSSFLDNLSNAGDQMSMTGTSASPSISATSLSPQPTMRSDLSTIISVQSPGSVTSTSTEVQRTPKAPSSAIASTAVEPGTLEVPTLPPLLDDMPSGFVVTSGPASPPPPPSLNADPSPTATIPSPPQTADADAVLELDSGPPPEVPSQASEEGRELTHLTGSLLDTLITIASDPQKIAETTEEGGFWLTLVSRHLSAVQANGDPMNASSVILEALFKYKQANVFYPNAKMSTMSVLSEVAPTTDVRDLVQQIGWLYSANVRAESEKQRQRAVKANWLMARSMLGQLYRIRRQLTESTKLCTNSLKTLRSMHTVPDAYAIVVSEHLQQSYAESGDFELSRDTKAHLERQLDVAGTQPQVESVKYFYEHCFKLLESATVYAWSGYSDFKEFASLLEGLCGQVHWRTTTLYAYFWIRWRENETRSSTLDKIALRCEMRSADLIGAFVALLYSRMPSEYQFPPVQQLFEDAVKAVRNLLTDDEIYVPLRKAWFGSFTTYMRLQGGLDPSSASALATRAIAMCLCNPEFSSLRELLSSEKYQRLPNAIPTLSMTPRSSISRFRPYSVDQSGDSVASRSMRDSSSVIDLPSNFMRRSWSSLGSGLLLGQRVSSLKSFYTGKSSRRTRDSKMMEITWDSDNDDDGDVRMGD